MNQKTWGDFSQEERKDVLKKVMGVYDELGHPSWLKKPKSIDQFVNDMVNQKQIKDCYLIFEGSAPVDQKDLAEKVKTMIKEATSSVSQVQVVIAAKYGVGAQLGTLAKLSKVFEDGTADLVHKEGEVWLCDLWATWCPPC